MHNRRVSEAVRMRDQNAVQEELERTGEPRDNVELRLLDEERYDIGHDKHERFGLNEDDDSHFLVRQVVPETDDPLLPSLTLRAVILLSLIHI